MRPKRRSKTARRLLAVALGLLLIGLACGALVAASRFQVQRRLARQRADGLAAASRSESPVAVQLLGSYLQRESNDPEVLLAFAVAREHLAEPDGQHLELAAAAYDRYCQLRPQDHAAALHAASLNRAAGRPAAAALIARALLPADLSDCADQDVPALLELCESTLRATPHDPRFPVVIDALRRLRPRDLTVIWACCRAMMARGESDRAAALASSAAAADDPTLGMLPMLVALHTGARVSDESVIRLSQWAGVDPATGEPLRSSRPIEVAAVLLAVEVFDGVGRPDLALGALRAAAGSGRNRTIDGLLVRRAWQSARPDLAIEHAPAGGPGDRGIDPDVIGLCALAQLDQADPDSALSMAGALAFRRGDVIAQAWAGAVRSAVPGAHLSASGRVRELQAAITAVPAEPVFHALLAEQLASAGLLDMACREWAIADREPAAAGWSALAIRPAEVLGDAGSVDAALDIAELAAKRYPREIRVRIGLLAAQALWVRTQHPMPGLSERLLQRIDAELTNPSALTVGPDPEIRDRLIEARISVLLALGRREPARASLASSLQLAPPPGVDRLIRFSAISRRAGFELEDRCLSLAESIGGRSPAVLVARALPADSDTGSALQLSQTPDDDGAGAEWGIALARLKELSNDPSVLSDWQSLIENNPADLRVLAAALRSPAVRDLEVAQGVCKRLADLLGQLPEPPRRAAAIAALDARLRSGSPDPDAGSVEVLAASLRIGAPSFAASQALLRFHLHRLAAADDAPDWRDALQHARELVELSPGSARAHLQLADLLERSEHHEEAIDEYRRAIALADGTEVTQALVSNNFACALLRAGAPLAAEALAPARRAAGTLGSAATLDTLARAQAATGDHSAAIQSFRRALAVEPTQPAALLGLANLLSTGTEVERTEARNLLLRVESAADPHAGPLGMAESVLSASLKREHDEVRRRLESDNP